MHEVLFESSSSESDEELVLEELYFLEKRKRRKISNYIEDVVDNCDDQMFRENFRMYRATFELLLHLLEDKISSSVVDVGRHTISSKAQLLLTIWYFATPDSYRSICERFNVGKDTGLRTGVCDHKLLFTHCYAGEVGSCHDAKVLKNSEVWSFITEAPNREFPRDTHLLGDKAYLCMPQLIPPYKNNGHLTRQQINFNYVLSSVISTVEWTSKKEDEVLKIFRRPMHGLDT
ncbi:uncharacterized protein [Tenebrio molitor]|uniref:uncharacterized protein n=1 Tax=Tenebrio molitor TaxID=7067 RepID=UPI0036247E51